MKMCEDIRNGKNMVCNIKKLLNNSIDLTQQGKGRKKQCKQDESTFCGFLPADRSTPTNQELLKQLVVPWVQRMYPDGKFNFKRIYCRSKQQGPPSSSLRNPGPRLIGCHIGPT